MDLHERTMQIKTTAEDASWSIREAAWNLEERLLWRGSDAARSRLHRYFTGLKEIVIRAFVRTRLAGRRVVHGRLPRVTATARRATEPVMRLVETRVVWPIADRWHEHGLIARGAVLAVVGVAAVWAGSTGIQLATQGGSDAGGSTEVAVSAPPIDLTSSEPTTLQGVATEFAAAAPPAEPGPVPEAVPAPTGPGATAVAWRFSQAFVDYEIGRPGAKTGLVFSETAAPDLAKALGEDPPRLPHGTPVPAARVLNVVLADETPKEVVASVS